MSVRKRLKVLILSCICSMSAIILAFSRTAQYYSYEVGSADKLYLLQHNDVASTLVYSVKMMGQGDDAPRPAPWSVPPNLVYNDSSWFSEDTPYVTSNFSFSPGQGNLMFIYASLLGISMKHGAVFLIPHDLLIRRSFYLPSSIVVNHDALYDFSLNWTRFRAPDCCRLYPELIQPGLNSSRTRVLGYFQSYKYFHHIRDTILQEFHFIAPIQVRAAKILRETLQEKGYQRENVILVGVHIRRGVDMTWNTRNIYHGHTVASKRYFNNAMYYFRNKFADKPLLFLLSSDDLYWTRQHLMSNNDTALISSGIREVDMRVLTLCDHTIMSQGTFSWWIAYLTGGLVVYYKNWPRQNSGLAKQLNPSEFFLPDWIPMD